MSPKLKAAKWGAQAHKDETGKLPTAFPRTIGPNARKYLEEVVDSGLLVDMMGRFEQRFAEMLGVKYCIATPGCTPALHVLMLAAGFEPGDEIIVSPVTDYGTIHGIVAEGLIPVFADTHPGTVNFSAETIEPHINARTRAILCVHKTGLINDMDAINALAARRRLMVFEDACQAVFGRYKGRLAGTLGDAAGFSFDAEKTMGSDVGGCLVTNDEELADRARLMGQSRGAAMQEGFGRLHIAPGYAYRMPNCTAAICLAQLDIIEEQVAHRDRMARLLTQLLAGIPGITPLPIPDYVDVYSCWMAGFNIEPDAFTCTVDEFARQCAEQGIPGAGTGRYYLMPEAVTYLEARARARAYPYGIPPASREHHYAGTCPMAAAFLDTFIRWSTFCEKYQPEDCELAASIVRGVAEANRR